MRTPILKINLNKAKTLDKFNEGERKKVKAKVSLTDDQEKKEEKKNMNLVMRKKDTC